LKRRDKRGTRRVQFTIEHFDGEHISGGCLFLDDSRHRRAVAEPIDVVPVLEARRVDADAARDAVHVRVCGMDTAVDDCDADTLAVRLVQIGQVQRKQIHERRRR
jgi:hypothetical protein